jgi:hypothetical protein
MISEHDLPHHSDPGCDRLGRQFRNHCPCEREIEDDEDLCEDCAREHAAEQTVSQAADAVAEEVWNVLDMIPSFSMNASEVRRLGWERGLVRGNLS